MKRSLILLITLTAVLLLTACNAASPSVTAPTTTAPTATETTAPTTEATTETTVPTTTAPTESPTVTVDFSTDKSYFSLDLPREWIGHYAVRETEDTVTFYELQNHQQSGQGKLFSIRYIPEDAYDEGMYPSYRELGIFDGFAIIAVFPTDVQFDVELMEPYTAMQAQIDGILATFYHLEEPGNG